jgi:hypothetical protein
VGEPEEETSADFAVVSENFSDRDQMKVGL